MIHNPIERTMFLLNSFNRKLNINDHSKMKEDSKQRKLICLN